MDTWLDNGVVIDEGLGKKIAITDVADQSARLGEGNIKNLNIDRFLFRIIRDQLGYGSNCKGFWGRHSFVLL